MDALGSLLPLLAQTFPDQVPVLRTRRLTLRGLNPSDAPALFVLFSDRRVTATTDVEPFESIEQAHSLIAGVMARFATRSAIRWGITRTGSDTVIGTIGFPLFADFAWAAEVGYDLVPDHWGQGLATEALRAVLSYGFEQLYLNRIEAMTLPDNAASMRVLARTGFTEEGILREYRYWAGAFHDLRVFSLLRRDYARLAYGEAGT